MNPRYALCAGGAYDSERWPLARDVNPGYEFNWEDDSLTSGSLYAVRAQIVQTHQGPMWVATPA